VVTKKDKHLAAAQKYLERGSLEKALVELQGAVKEDAKDTRTWLRMAEVHVRLGQNDKATEVYQKTVDLYVEQGFFQRAVAVYKNIIKLAPESVTARIKLGDVYRQLGLFSDAIQQLDQAVGLLQRAGENGQALAALKQIIELNPEQPATRIRYAELAVQAGENDDAVAEFREAANMLRAQGRTDEFARVAERVLFYQPDDLALAVELARIYLDRNNPRAALTRLKPAFDANQGDPEVLDLLARSFEQLGQPNKSVPVLKELCRVYANSGRMSERNQTLQRALALEPNDTELRAMLGGRTGTDTSRGASVTPLHRMPSLSIPSPPPASAAVAVASPVPPTSAASFGETEVPEALQTRYKTPSSDIPAGPVDRVAIASDMVEKTDDEAEIKRILAESDVFVKYGLVERAAEHLRRVFERVPTHTGAHERLAAVLVQLGRKSEAAAEMEVLSQQLLPVSRAEAADYAKRALALNPNAKRAAEVLATIEGKARAVASPAEALAGMIIPEPEATLDSQEIELLGDSATVSDEEAGTGAVAELAAAFGSGKVDEGETEDGFVDDQTPASPMTTPDSEELEIEIRRGPAPIANAASPVPVPNAEDETDAILDASAMDGLKDAAITAPMEDAVSESMLSDLEQVDFFIEQELYDDAQVLLDELDERHPGHALTVERREKLRNFRQSSQSLPSESEIPTPAPNVPAVVEPMAQAARSPIPAMDLDTEADLGVMNKTMERHDLAIQHFTCLLGDPKREVFALTMIGESQEALGNHAEAIRCYQDALRRSRATEEEATQLYFLLGNVFYNKGDRAEALYYFERVCKRDPSFRDVQRRLAALKSRGSPH
jgi:pilus assembly protein FimV